MGWYFSNSSRDELIKELTRGWSNDRVTARCLAHTLRGNVLWTAWEHVYADGQTDRFIGCDLLSSHEGSWGHKPMDEAMGPCYYTCPLSYLEMVPPANEEWRAKVRAYHARCRERRQVCESLFVGDRVRCHPNRAGLTEVEVVSRRPLLVRSAWGRLFRIPSTLIAEVLPRNREVRDAR